MLSGRNLNSFFTVFGRNEVVDQMGWVPAHDGTAEARGSLRPCLDDDFPRLR